MDHVENLSNIINFNNKSKHDIPVWEKLNLTIEETAIYSNIGENTLRELIKDLTNRNKCDFVLNVGNKKLIKRKQFEDYISKVGVI